ncbi:hypothetical protein RUM43_003520 [Polyplax serrata]|uniref:Uncharacterized protein n=1 Tax=Polyplax serrata TaxID=468196 RepID=A0AAN8PFN3_POLSC
MCGDTKVGKTNRKINPIDISLKPLQKIEEIVREENSNYTKPETIKILKKNKVMSFQDTLLKDDRGLKVWNIKMRESTAWRGVAQHGIPKYSITKRDRSGYKN